MSEDRLFLTILRGPNPRDATPILATEDQELIRAVGRALRERMDLAPPSDQALRLFDPEQEKGGE